MRICFVVGQFAPVIGGTEGQIRQLAAGLARRGHSVEVVTQTFPGARTREQIDGVAVSRSIRTVRGGPFFGLTYGLSLALALVRRQSPDLFQIAFAHWDAAVAGWLRRVLRRPVVVRIANTEAGGDLGRLRSSPYWPLIHAWDALTVDELVRAIKRCDAFVVATPQMALSLTREGFPRDRISQIANGVDHCRFRPPNPKERVAARAALGFRDERVIATVGRLERWKGPGDLVMALPRLPKRVHLVLVGDGAEREALVASTRALGVEAQVHLMGWRRDILPVLWAADVFALPSHTEGMPNALLEAMAAGLPCVVTTVGAAAEVLDSGTSGSLVPPGDPPALASALAAMLDDECTASRFGAAARARVEACFTLDEMVKRYEALYDELLCRSTG